MFGINIYPVIYSNDFPQISTYEEFLDHHEIVLKACRTKSTDWAYEKEWRLFGEYKINEPYQSGKIVKMAKASSIYMGANIDRDTKRHLVKICQEKSIKLYQMQLAQKRYGLLTYQIL